MIIDGHNLIPHMPGVNLSDPDDEMQLIQMVQSYCRLRRRTAEIYFDKAPAGQARAYSTGMVKAVFVRTGRTADDAIIDRLKQLGRRAKNCLIVSSDRQVQQASRAVHADVVSAAAFAADWRELSEQSPEFEQPEQPLTEDEITYWQQLFENRKPPESGN